MRSADAITGRSVVPDLAIRNGVSRAASVVTGLVLVAGLIAAVPDAAADSGPVAGRQAVATENAASSRAALAVLESGGNAVDAAVTAALVAGVASPSSSGLGGGGFALVYDAKRGEVSSLDFRETAPAGIDVAAFERRPLVTAERGKLIGTPGEPAGLWELHRRFGKKRWADVVTPAVRVAREGYAVSPHLARSLSLGAQELSLHPPLASVYLVGGRPAVAQATLKNGFLAATLERLAQEGPRGYYEGTIAAELVATSKSGGGALTTEDLANYHVTERTPLHLAWEGYDIYTMGPPSAGGVLLGQTLGTFSAADLRALGRDTDAYRRALAESMRYSFADRFQFIGDPARENVDVAALLAPKRLAERRRTIAPEKIRSMAASVQPDHGTHHLVTADAYGNVVSLTTTVNNPFGSGLAGPTTGILLNDELDDFTPGAVSKKLGIPTSPNRPRAGAKPVSSMTPTIVMKDGKVVLALGGSGGMTIAPNVTQVLLSRLAFGATPTRAVEGQRFRVPTLNGPVLDSRGTPALQLEFEQRGAVQVVAIENGRMLPASDPRKFGSAVAH